MKKALQEVLNEVESAFPSLRDTAHLVLSVAATTRLLRQHPLSVILIGGPSSGKTSMLMPLTRAEQGSTLKGQVVRVDDFTPASLVSGSANRTKEELARNDLLPKLQGKCVVVKEMAPVFTGSEDDLMKKFGVLASVLDGEGYVRATGTHGERGYSERIAFSLLGAVTPSVLTTKVQTCLNAVGPRFCFWTVPARNIEPDSWTGPGLERGQVEEAVSQAIRALLETIFREFPPASVDLGRFAVSSGVRVALSQIAILMTLLRTKARYDTDDEGRRVAMPIAPESPERAFRYLEQLALGSALLDGRFQVQDTDLHLPLGVALSSAFGSRQVTARAFFQSEADLTVLQLSERIGVNTDTAMFHARQLEALGIVERVNPDGTTSWNLKSPFRGLRLAMAFARASDSQTMHPLADPEFTDNSSGNRASRGTRMDGLGLSLSQ